MSATEKDRNVYCKVHRMYKVKNANGTFVCVKCKVEE